MKSDEKEKKEENENKKGQQKKEEKEKKGEKEKILADRRTGPPKILQEVLADLKTSNIHIRRI